MESHRTDQNMIESSIEMEQKIKLSQYNKYGTKIAKEENKVIRDVSTT